MYNQQATTENNYRGFGPKCGSFKEKFDKRFGGGHQWKQEFRKAFGNRKAANIQETDNEFVISLYAAGLSKSDFKISVTNDILSISYTAPQTAENETNFIHQEYQPSNFERSFQLNDKVISDTISATYQDGVLKVTLPKNPATNKPAQEVKIG